MRPSYWSVPLLLSSLLFSACSETNVSEGGRVADNGSQDGSGDDNDEGGGNVGGNGGGNGGGDGGGGGDAVEPSVDQVTISPAAIYVDGPATCEAAYTASENGATVEYSWHNVTRGQTLGQGTQIQLSPSDILPGEELACRVKLTDSNGQTAQSKAQIEPVCGLYDLEDLDQISFEVSIMFRPWKSDDLAPGDEGEPWDWDGGIPNELFELAEVLSHLLGFVSEVYPDPDVLDAQEALEQIDEIGSIVDKVAPFLLDGSVPPDPDLYPYLVDEEGYITTYWPKSDGGLRWDDTYEVSISAENQDLYTYDAFAVDIEDVDVAFDDSMGDYLDQEDSPLMLAWPVFAESAYCTATYYNPEPVSRETDYALIPSSILWMHIDVW